MSDSINIDFSPLTKTADPVGNYVNAFKIGRQLAGEQITSNAMQAYATNPGAPLDPRLAAANPDAYLQLQDRSAKSAAGTAIANGDYDTAMKAAGPLGPDEVAKVQQFKATASAQQKAAALQAAQAHAVAAHALLMVTDPQEQYRQAVAAAPGLGFSPDQVPKDPQQLHDALVKLFQSGKTFEQIVADDKPTKIGKDESLLFAPGSLGSAEQAGGAGTPAATPTSAPASPGGVPGMIAAAAAKYGVDPHLALAVAHAESNFDPSAKSPKGAIGVMQLMPGTAQDLGVDPNDPAANIDGGVRYLSQLSKQFNGDPKLIAAAYNAGPGAVHKAGGVPNFPETQAYVGKVTGDNGSYQVASNGPTPPPPSGRTPLPGGYTLVKPGGDAPDTHGHIATPAELAAAGLPKGTQAWTNAKGEVGDMPKAIADQLTTAAAGQGDQTKTGADFLKSLPQSRRLELQPYLDGRLPIPTQRAAETPQGEALIRDLTRADPQLDLADATARVKTRVAFTSGKPAANITSLNTAVNHLGQLYDSIDKMGNNTDIGTNAIRHAVTPLWGDTRYRDFRAAASRAAPEIATALKGGYATEPDIAAVTKQFSEIDSPDQLKETIRNMIEGLGGRLDPLTEQYNQGMGTTKGRFDLLEAAPRATIARIMGGGKSQPSPQAAPAAPRQVAPGQFKTDDGYVVKVHP